jgi:hypothetical protein
MIQEDFMLKQDWIPHRERDLVDLIAKWIAALSNMAKRADFGWDSDVCMAVLLKLEEFLNAYAEYKAIHTPVKRLVKDDARKAAVDVMRSFAKSDIRFNRKMTETDRMYFGLREPDTKWTPKSDPTDLVTIEFSTIPEAHSIVAKYRIEGSTKRGKGSYHAAEVRYWVRALDAAPPVDANEEGWQGMANTASPWKKTLAGADAGKRLFVTMRWVNAATSGEEHNGKGLWNRILSIIIP